MFKIPCRPDYPDLDQLKPAISQTRRCVSSSFELFNGKLPELLCISNLLFNSQARRTSKTWANLCVSMQNSQDFGHFWFEKSSFRRVKLLAGSGRSWLHQTRVALGLCKNSGCSADPRAATSQAAFSYPVTCKISLALFLAVYHASSIFLQVISETDQKNHLFFFIFFSSISMIRQATGSYFFFFFSMSNVYHARNWISFVSVRCISGGFGADLSSKSRPDYSSEAPPEEIANRLWRDLSKPIEERGNDVGVMNRTPEPTFYLQS